VNKCAKWLGKNIYTSNINFNLFYALVGFLIYGREVGAVENIFDNNVGVVNDVHHAAGQKASGIQQAHPQG